MDTVILQQKFKAPIKAVWEAITLPELMKEWYFKVHNFELKPGNVFTFYGDDQQQTYLHSCEILQVEPLTLLEYTWTHPDHSKGRSVLRWELSGIDEAHTLLTLTHSGLESFADAGPEFAPENYEFGWKGIISISLRNFLHDIGKQLFEIDIQAPREKVWQKMWSKEGYTAWTSEFTEGSYYEGELKAGETVHLLSPEGNGLYSDVIFMQENKLMILSHIGIIIDGEEQDLDEETEYWTGILESYRLSDNEDGSTHLSLELDNQKEYFEKMNESFPRAFRKLKEICEQ